MAYQNAGWVWNVVGVTSAEYVVLLFLANEANSKGVTPNTSIDKIMRKCLQSRRMVFQLIKKLETKGFVKRNREYTVHGDYQASTFVLDTTRYFPKGEYEDAMQMWKQILSYLKAHPGSVHPTEVFVLGSVREAFIQKNSKMIYLVTDAEYCGEILMKNLRHIKIAAVTLKLPLRRFEVFRIPYLK